MDGARLKPARRTAAVARVVLLVGALTAALAGAVPPSSAAPRHDRPLGRPVTASASPRQAPLLGSGRYVTRMPGNSSTYLRLRRTAPGTTLHVGATMTGHGHSIGEGFDLEVGTRPGGGDCGSAVAFRPTLHEPAPVLYAATSTWSSSSRNPCTSSRTLYVQIHPPSDMADAHRQLQLWVYEEPPVDDSSISLLTTPTPSTWGDMTPEAPKPARPARTIDRAPVVGDGTYALSLRPGDDDFLAVPMGWGDSLRAQIDTELPASADPNEPGLTLDVLGPVLDTADTGDLGADPSIGPTRDRRAYRTGVMTQTISYVNRESVDPGVNGADLAGIHYVALSYQPTSHAAALPVRLTLQVMPSDSPAPIYRDVHGVHPPRADSRLVDGSLAKPPPHRAASRPESAFTPPSGLPWGTIGLVVAGLVALGGVVELVVRWRRRRSARRYRGRHRD
ncbi:MAG: hypothetical protein FWE71_12895 [Nocardioidaceae bacterium]|nr:hypothetical protein [Nocardioidaceae bacterium]MCL2614844.1 hypothetical protein [Nocardioidaceae bacterium]